MQGRERGRTAPAVTSVLAAFALVPLPLAGQDPGSALFPTRSYFDVLIAAPREPRFSGSLISTDLLGGPRATGAGTGAEMGGRDREAQIAVGLGGTLRLWRAAEWRGGGAVLGVQTGVFGRFRMEGSANALVATDWLIGVPLELRRGRLSGRVRFLHWSAHLGDEYLAEAGADRVDFTFEAVDALAAWDVGAFRVYGGGSRILRSQLADAEDAPPGFTDRGTIQLGADGRWYPWWEGGLGLRAGLDLQWADRTDGRTQASATAAVEVRGPGRSLRAGLSWFDGPSPLGQFFLDRESLWGFEVRIDL